MVWIYYTPTDPPDGFIWYYLLTFLGVSNCPTYRLPAPGILAPSTGVFVPGFPLVPLLRHLLALLHSSNCPIYTIYICVYIICMLCLFIIFPRTPWMV